MMAEKRWKALCGSRCTARLAAFHRTRGQLSNAESAGYRSGRQDDVKTTSRRCGEVSRARRRRATPLHRVWGVRGPKGVGAQVSTDTHEAR
jgi:hypothetical protein